MMHGTIQKWGNSQGIRLPKGALQIAKMKVNDPVEIEASDDQIIIRRVPGYKNLDALFASYEGEYQPAEVDTGEPVGREVF